MTRDRLFGRASLSSLDEDLIFLRTQGLNAEVYLSADMLDSLDDQLVKLLVREREEGRKISFHAPFMDLSPAGLDSRVLEITRYRFRQVMELSEKIDPVNIVFHPGYDKWRYEFHDDLWLNNSEAFWQDIIEWGTRQGTQIVLENVFDIMPDHLVALRKRVGKELGFCFDAGHFLLFSEVSMSEWLNSFGDGLKELHLHDNFGTSDDHLPVGEGDFDFDQLLKYVEKEEVEPLIVLENHTYKETARSLVNFFRITELKTF
jgi:sugar phosphate isomerase/epimerase